VAAADKQRQWNDKRNDKQDRVNKGPARAEKRTSARQARVAHNHPANVGEQRGWSEALVAMVDGHGGARGRGGGGGTEARAMTGGGSGGSRAVSYS